MGKSSSSRKKSVWKIPGLEKRVQALVQSGLLLKKDGVEEIVRTISTEFAEPLAAANVRLTRFALTTRLHHLIWTRTVKGDLWRAISNKMLDRFRVAYPYIPESEMKKRVRGLKGLTKTSSVAEFKAGMGRLNLEDLPRDAGRFEFPEISAAAPYPVVVPAEWQGMLINGALVGIKYPDIERNPLRRALADARKRGAAFVVLTNLIELHTKKTAGFLAVYRAQASGLKINPDRFPAEYQEQVRDIVSGAITDKLIYQTLGERFNEIADGLMKLSQRPKEKGPEFTGPVLIVLGPKEEELINAAAYYECRYMTILEQNRIEAELKMANNRLIAAEKVDDFRNAAIWAAEVERLTKLKARTIITNIADEQLEFYRRRARAFVVGELQRAIPNSRVISQGTTYLKTGDKTIRIYVPASDNVSTSTLADVADVYGAHVFRDVLADVTISCPQYSLNHRMVGREDSRNGVPVTKFIMTAPSCLDGEYLRSELKDTTKAVPRVVELIFDPQFEPGVLLLQCSNGLLHVDAIPVAKLDGFGPKPETTNFAFPYPRTKYITIFANTDNHFGSATRREIWDPKDRIHRGSAEAAIEMLRRAGVLTGSDIRVHLAAEMDDASNGDLWFKPRYRPDPQLQMIAASERATRELSSQIRRVAEKGDANAVVRLTDELQQFSMEQAYLRGNDFPFHQMQEVFDRHLDPNVDFYSAVLDRFLRSKVALKPISAINKTRSDTRDLGVVNFPEGNHRINTLEQGDLEGDYMAMRLQELLAQRPEWRRRLASDPSLLKRLIRAPRFGNVTFGWGIVQAPGGYPWGLRVHGSPARQSGWSDILDAVIKSDLARGDDSYGLMKTVCATLFGDKHFFARAVTARMRYYMCAAAVHNDTYGSAGGFPPNNTGVCFLSLPADGPDAGPEIMRMLPHDVLRDWFANPRPFDWSTFLPEPV